jgi:hypothetical protein
MVTGCFLNSYLEDNPFAGRKKYKVCKTLFSLFDTKNLQKKEQVVMRKNLKSTKLGEGDGGFPATTKRTRKERSVSRLHRKFGVMNEEDVRKLKRVKITLDNASESYCRQLDKGEEQEERRRERTTWLDQVRLCTQGYRVPYKDLKIHKRLRRVDKIGAEIVAACIDQRTMRDEGVEYVIQNQQFAHEILNIVNGLKERIGSKLKVDLHGIMEPEVCHIIDEDEEVDEVNLEDSTNIGAIDIGRTLLGEMTSRAYQRVRQKLESNNVNLPWSISYGNYRQSK